MGEIYVSSYERLSEIINQLRNLNTQFRNKATDINTEHSILTTKWEGDSSTAFQERFRKEYPNFENFASAIDGYIEGLTQIRDEYDAKEGMNKIIANG